MDFALSAEQEALRRSVQAMLDKESSLARVREVCLEGDGVAADLWRILAQEYGLVGLALPEDLGGAGASLVEVAVVQEQLGYHLTPVPYLSTVLAATLLARHAADDTTREVVRQSAEGDTILTCATSPDRVQVTVEGTSTQKVVTGEIGLVLEGHVADAVLITAEVDGSPALVLVHLEEGTTRRERLDGLDLTRAVVDLHLIQATATVVASMDTRAEVRRTAAILLAAEQAGVARAALDMSTAYARTREQFGRPIGSYQAIKHRCADMFVSTESAWSTAFYAAWSVEGDPGQVEEAAVVARAVCSEGARSATAACIQVHGGIGFTWEHDAHLLARRAKGSALLLGDPRGDLDDLAGSLLARAEGA
jgi:alkylation response protein AidB-like acyl-CoA dehydrogenase